MYTICFCILPNLHFLPFSFTSQWDILLFTCLEVFSMQFTPVTLFGHMSILKTKLMKSSFSISFRYSYNLWKFAPYKIKMTSLKLVYCNGLSSKVRPFISHLNHSLNDCKGNWDELEDSDNHLKLQLIRRGKFWALIWGKSTVNCSSNLKMISHTSGAKKQFFHNPFNGVGSIFRQLLSHLHWSSG